MRDHNDGPRKKALLRAEMRKLRRTMGGELRTSATSAFDQQLLSTGWLCTGCHVAGYSATGSELNLSCLFETLLARGMNVYLPRINTSNELQFLRYRGEKLQLGAHGILAPNENNAAIATDDIDLMLIPMLACDQSGNRLGQGGGYYDRYLAKHSQAKLKRIGVGFEFQFIAELPAESFDQRLAALITEQRVRLF